MTCRSIFLFSILIAIGIGCDSEPDADLGKPNILWITSEDNSPLLGAYGDTLATTPNLDRLADRGIVYDNAFATTPVCAPSRFTLITGLYANIMGTENMRSTYPVPDFVKFFPKYLKEAGYYTTNNVKKDYNTVDQPEAWDESSDSASYKNREPGQPFFHVRNFTTTHESRLHDPIDTLIHDPDRMSIPPYHPETPAVKRDWAHYYDQVSKMDAQVREILDELERSGEAENTIVFYYSDHGGVLPRSKRFMFESGLRIPLIVYFPEKYAHLAPDAENGRTGRLVSFVDFAPTVLSLAGIEPPGYMHGNTFLGRYSDAPREYVHTYRGRMDERYDLIRAVRDKEYLYVHNYMPQRIYGQHLAYLWRAPSMQSWEQEYLNGNLNDIQRRFFEAKPAEELYKIKEDPHNVNNLAPNPEYREVLMRMRKINSNWMMEMNDLGVIPESRIDSLRGDQSLFTAVRNRDVPIDEIIETAEQASWGSEESVADLAKKLDHPDPSVRYWGAMGLAIGREHAFSYRDRLEQLANDPSPIVRIAVAEALFGIDEMDTAMDLVVNSLDHPDFNIKLQALNLMKSIELAELSSSLRGRLNKLIEEHNDEWGTDYYIRRAAMSVLEKS